MQTVNLEKQAPTVVMPSVVMDGVACATPVEHPDTLRLKYLANIDDGDLAEDLQGTNYANWCKEIDKAIARHQSLDSDDDGDSDWDDWDEEEDQSSAFQSITGKLILAIVAGYCITLVMAGVFASTYPGVIGTLVGICLFGEMLTKTWGE